MSQKACYRYRTIVLVGPWRRQPERALEDAIGAGQARRESKGAVLWTAGGKLEQSLCDRGGPCGGIYPPD